jgi:hypothetical protein
MMKTCNETCLFSGTTDYLNELAEYPFSLKYDFALKSNSPLVEKVNAFRLSHNVARKSEGFAHTAPFGNSEELTLKEDERFQYRRR